MKGLQSVLHFHWILNQAVVCFSDKNYRFPTNLLSNSGGVLTVQECVECVALCV